MQTPFDSSVSLSLPKSRRRRPPREKRPSIPFPKVHHRKYVYNNISQTHITTFTHIPHKQTITPNPHADGPSSVPNAHPSSDVPRRPRAPDGRRDRRRRQSRDAMERIHSHIRSRVIDAMKHRRRRRVVWGVVADATASLAARTREREEKRDGRGINALHPRIRRAFVRSSEDDDDGYFLFLLFTPSSSSRRRRRRRSGGRARSRARTPRDAFPRAPHSPNPLHPSDGRVRSSAYRTTDVSASRSRASTRYIFRRHVIAHAPRRSPSLCRDPRPDSSRSPPLCGASAPNQTKPNQTKPNQTGPNRTKPDRTPRAVRFDSTRLELAPA